MREKLRRMPDYCETELALEVIGGKWKPVILYNLLEGTKRFGRLKRTMPNVTLRMLTRQLGEMEEDGLLRRTVYAEVPPKVEYSLTEFDASLPLIVERVDEWGAWYRARAGNGSGPWKIPAQAKSVRCGVGGPRRFPPARRRTVWNAEPPRGPTGSARPKPRCAAR